jgi:ribosomal protein S18 acetylase RimI-like enzyme
MATTIRNYDPGLGEAVEALQRSYIAANPKGTKFISPDFYWDHPASARGQNVFCAFDGEELVGYGALIPTPAEPDAGPGTPNTVWIYIRVDPAHRDRLRIQHILFDKIMSRSSYYDRLWHGRRTRVAISYPETRTEEILFFRTHGLESFGALLQMHRDLSAPLPGLYLPMGLILRRWLLETPSDKQRYVAAEARAFPHAPRTVQEIDFCLQSWTGGTLVSAFDSQDVIVGSVMAYWYDSRAGVTEDVFVLPDWRRQGVARCLVGEGIKYLIENGIARAWLEVRESNVPAVRLYQSLGYLVANREEQLCVYL